MPIEAQRANTNTHINREPPPPGLDRGPSTPEPVPQIAIPPNAMTDAQRSIFARNHVRGADAALHSSDPGVQERAWRNFGAQGQADRHRWTPEQAAAAYRAVTGKDPTPQQMAWYREGLSELRFESPRNNEFRPPVSEPLLRGLVKPHD